MLLHEGPAHGYTLLERLKEFGLAEFDPSIVYRALREMEVQGWIISTWDEERSQGPPRRVYRLTPLGDEVLAGWTKDLEETRGLIDHLLGVYRRHMAEAGDHHAQTV